MVFRQKFADVCFEHPQWSVVLGFLIPQMPVDFGVWDCIVGWFSETTLTTNSSPLGYEVQLHDQGLASKMPIIPRIRETSESVEDVRILHGHYRGLQFI